MRINNSGTYEPCRWMTKKGTSRVDVDRNINKVEPLLYFQKHMANFRTDLLQGKTPLICEDCHVMEQYGKPSGRQKQLLKVGVLQDYFEKSLASSPMLAAFDHSQNNQGLTDRTVADWQIDLGNYCNGSCVFCPPESSSSVASEYLRLGLIQQVPPPAWCDDPESLDRFITALRQSDHIQYLHFIGGETLITPGFKKILQALVDAQLAQKVTVGFTTNLTVWSDSTVDLLQRFAQVNLGMSVETLSAVNDYVRYPSQQGKTRKMLDQWLAVGKRKGWLMQLRMTPTCLSVHDLHTVYDYAWHNQIATESCNFLDHPAFFRISVLPQKQRQQVIDTLDRWIQDHPVTPKSKIFNTRDPNLAHEQIIQDAQSYVNYLESAPDESHRLPELVTFLKLLESNRSNSVLSYVPQYEDLFRSAGY